MSKEEKQDSMKISVIYLNLTNLPVTALVLLTSIHSKSKITSLLNIFIENPGINMRPVTSQASLQARTLRALSILTQF